MALAEQVAYYNKTSAEYIRPLEDNAQRLKTYIERDDFSNRSDKAQKLLIAQYDMPTSILTDAYKIRGAGSALNIVA
ncbi:MAG: hypothetical protein LBF86_03015 [Helicobacteraceae bacterium]|nr:hypothetical protein [Helicobacteraceae bacterium]